ncbi:MAG: hypothetical protein QXP53_00960 [Candidatus Pacearchaeota archaeon]
MKGKKNIHLFLSFKERKQEKQAQNEEQKKGTGISGMLEQTPLASWVPAIKKIKSTVTESVEEVTKSIKDLRKAGPLALSQHIELSDIRALLSNEKARLLHLIKTKKPSSIYKLAKLSARDFKAVREDLRTLEKFGLIKMVKERTKAREKLKPVLQVNKLNLSISI